jgi:ankyrin repeat protein
LPSAIRILAPIALIFSVPAIHGRQTTAPVDAEAIFRAIRANDLQLLRTLTTTKQAANATDHLQTTPLHYAALFGSSEALQLLLNAGADPNATNLQGLTPLIYAAYDFEKTKALVEGGAKINVSSHIGSTPLMVAASTQTNAATVRYLLEKSADPIAKDKIGQDALINAGWFADEETVALLLAHGVSAKNKDKFGFNALANAVAGPTGKRIDVLMQAGSDVNAANTFGGEVKNGPLALVHLTPLMLAAPYANTQTIDTFLKAGAHVNDVDIRKMTPLMLAVATDFANLETVRHLISAGADVNAKDQNGESVLDWALKFRDSRITGLLEQAGAKPAKSVEAPVHPASYRAADASDALSRSAPLLARSSQGFFSAGGGCWGCHHQPMAARAYAAGRDAGLDLDPLLRKVQLDALVAGRARTNTFSTVLADTGGDFDIMISPLAAMADMREPASVDSDIMVHYIAARQQPSGAWHEAGTARPPIEESDISRTALAVRALKTYGWPARQAEFDERILRARAWLLQAKPVTNYERADLLMGLFYAGAPTRSIQETANALLKQQRSDGGWAQTAYLDSDAYATGMALHALYITGMMKPSVDAYKKGVAYLLTTQFPDGSWYVRSRAPKFQPYFQSGFPFDHDQWISSAATGWAAMALAPAAALEKKKAVAAIGEEFRQPAQLRATSRAGQ